MGTIKILRRSISKFLEDHHLFTIIPTLCILPFSTSFLLPRSQLILFPASHPLPWFHSHLLTLFAVAGFPASSVPYGDLALKISETVASFVHTFPFAFTFLLFGKSLTLELLSRSKPSSRSLVLRYTVLIRTYIFGLTGILSANATAFFVLLLAFNCLKGLGLSSRENSVLLSIFGAIVYSTILSYAVVASNLALIISGVQKNGGCITILKACFLMRQRKLTVLSLAVTVNLLLAATEALFQYRMANAYVRNQGFSLGMVSEGCFIAYWYSAFIVLDTVISHTFLQRCGVHEGDDTNCDDYKCWMPHR